MKLHLILANISKQKIWLRVLTAFCMNSYGEFVNIKAGNWCKISMFQVMIKLTEIIYGICFRGKFHSRVKSENFQWGCVKNFKYQFL